MPTQVQSRPPTTDPLSPSRGGGDKFPPAPHDPMHPSSCDSRAKFNLQHREALRLALGSILAPKRPSVSGSRSSSGTASPAHSFSGSSGTYTPATPYSPSSEACLSQEHTFSRHHMPHSQYHPTHAPSRLGRAESHSDPGSGDTNPSPPPPPSPPLQFAHPVGPPHPLFRSRSHNPSCPSPPRTSPRLPAKRPSTAAAESADPGLLTQRPTLPDGTTSNVGSPKAASAEVPSIRVSSVADRGAVLKPIATPQQHDGHTQHDSIEHSRGSGCPGTPKAKFLETLQSKSAWDALIHGSFS